MQRRAVFLDFDGTLADHGVIPSAHVRALEQAQANGHAMVLCTGRAVSLVGPEVRALFDALVCSAGCWVCIGEQVVQDIRYPAHLAERTIAVLTELGVSFALEGPDTTEVDQGGWDRLQDVAACAPQAAEGGIGRGAEDLTAGMRCPEGPFSTEFAKAAVWNSPIPVEELAGRIGPEIRPLPNSVTGDGATSGELQLAAVDKIDGARLAAEHLGIPIEHTIAAGDGMNDLHLLAGVGTAIVIDGSAVQPHVEAGVTVPGPRDGGLATAFAQLGLTG